MDRGPNNAMSMANGNGPGGSDWTRRRQGWDIRPESSWKLTSGQDPA